MGFETILAEEYKNKYESIWPNKTILEYLNESIKKSPDKVALIDKKSRYTFEEVGKLVDRVALGLYEFGLRKGDVISFQLPNWNEFVILYLAVTKIGAISNPLIPIYRDREIGYMVKHAEAKMLVVPDEFRGFDYPEMVNRLLPEWPSMEHVFVLGSKVPSEMKSFSLLVDEPWEEKKDRSILDQFIHDANEINELIFTSGTTGEPKGVMHTHNTALVSSQALVPHLELTTEDIVFMASTFAHQTGFLYGVLLPIIIGGTAVYQDIWNPNEFVELIEKEKITFTTAATPFLQDLIQVEAIAHYDLSSLRYFSAIGAPIPRAIVKEASEKLPCKIMSGWGQTENGLVTLTSPTDTVEKLTSTDGKQYSGMEVKVVDECGNPTPPNIEGSLLTKGPALFVGYLKRMEQTLAEYDGEWFITGDQAVMDEDGYIKITGRNKDIIIRGGENIPVAYVENILYEHPDISIAQIVAMPDLRLQEKACAFINMKQGTEPITMESLRVYLEDKGVAKQYWPERVEIIDDFPRTPSGKIQKFRLRQMIEEKLGTEVQAKF
jgi:cyclohexanecarboxylate-CoA ligase